ncbi:D-alanine--D-alanine ligase [bioreactor metagenome]|uniref:D-alanine--D-alanine ligase n=1 Tax=bioreactor metagenome TaxID=1076179 RepID=A0A644Z4I4_9ZZZZ
MQYFCPSGLADAENAAIQELVVKAFRSLDCRGWARADVLIRKSDRKLFLLEINTSPGMTGHSLVPMSAKASGIDYPELCMRILASASLDARQGTTANTQGASAQ